MANANLALIALTLATIIVALAQVSAYTPTIDDNGFPPFADGLPIEEPNNRRDRCRGQIQGQQLNHCHMHLTTQQQGSTSSYFASILRMMAVVENPTTQQDQHLQWCCDQLKQVKKQCQCEAIQKVVQQAQMQQQQAGISQQEIMLRKAQMLPNQCNLKLQQCSIRIPYRV